MKNYTADQFIKFTSEQVDQIQKSEDVDALDHISAKEDELDFLNPEQLAHLKEYYTDTMEKYRLIYEAIVAGFSTSHKTGFPEHIYNIDLSTGDIKTDKNGRRINYSTEVLAPCTSAILHYINGECNDTYVVLPPIKGAERTVEKIISECRREQLETKKKNLARFNDAPEEEPLLPIFATQDGKLVLSQSVLSEINSFSPTPACPTPQKIAASRVDSALVDCLNYDPLPKDIYRLSILSKYRSDIESLITELEKKFPKSIRFEEGERNSYKKHLSENERNYFDIKKTARITIPHSKRRFYVEFQFKQTNMFFAHIRSHLAYEEWRVLNARYLSAKEEKGDGRQSEESKKKVISLKKQCEEKRQLCLKIHQNAVHQSNLYLMSKLQWLDDNARGLKRIPEHKNGQYKHSIDCLKQNYIIESYDPFDATTAFSTAEDEYLNKACYLKMIQVLPESFDELGKNAKIHINKAWQNLTEADIKDFNALTSIALKYQDVIRSIQKEHRSQDKNFDRIQNKMIADMMNTK